MNKIHISSNDGQSSEYDAEQVRLMLQQGLLHNNSLYWQKGMDEWLPITNLFPISGLVEETPPPMPPKRSRSDLIYRKDPKTITRALKIFLWVSFVIGALSSQIYCNLIRSIIASSQISPGMQETKSLVDFINFIIYLPTGIVTAILFLMWIYRSNLNCHGFGAKNMKFTPGWSIGYYFIPFLNLVRPYQAMKEIWKVSSDPANWQKQEINSVIRWWWGLWLVSGGMDLAISSMESEAMELNSLSSLIVFRQSLYFKIVIDLALTIFAHTLISSVITMQSKLVKNNFFGN